MCIRDRYLGIVDEYHAHKTNQMYKLLEGGIKKLKSALISVITTAGFDLKSPCYKLYEYCCNLLKGVFENDAQFVYIAQMDENDDRYNPENWIKANPILEFDRDALENLVPIANTARDMGGEDLRDFLVKQLNMWMQWSNSLYIKDIAKWKACAVLKSLKEMCIRDRYMSRKTRRLQTRHHQRTQSDCRRKEIHTRQCMRIYLRN